MPRAHIVEKFSMGSSNTLYSILRHESYRDYWLDYQKLSLVQKEELASLLRN